MASQDSPAGLLEELVAERGRQLKEEIGSAIDKRMLDLKEEMAGRIASDVIEQIRTAASGLYFPREIRKIMAHPEYGIVNLLIVHEYERLGKAIDAARRHVAPIEDKFPDTYFEFFYASYSKFVPQYYDHFVDVMVRPE